MGALCAIVLVAKPAYARSEGVDGAALEAPSGSTTATDGNAFALDAPVNLAPARISISRAADLVGQPVYFSQSKGIGSAGLVSISSRRLPAGSVFSVALHPIVPASFKGASMTSLGSMASLGSMPASMPVAALGITSGFGMRQHPILGVWRTHAGLDLAASYGSPIVATSDGVVSSAGWQGGYGLLVTLDHGGGLQTRYGHMSRLNVEPGQPVRKGNVIGYVGSSGLATGPHLHYEIRLNGLPINPATHLNGR